MSDPGNRSSRVRRRTLPWQWSSSSRRSRAAAYQLQRIGTNLNQLTRLAHRDYRLALEADLRATAKAVRAAIEDLR